MQSKILAAVDGSECAKKGFQIALDMSLEKQDSPVLVVLAVVQPLEVIGMRKDVRASLEALIEKDAKALLAEYATVAEMRGVKAETILASGHPAKIIIDIAKIKGADLIVVGSRGLGGVKGLLLGSVSNAVVQNSKVPVMVVK
jgi:nucleotide-binding universal stress UspA family protein